jgi:NitT/TauT family transport system permease protein
VSSAVPGYARQQRRRLLGLPALPWSAVMATVAVLLVDLYARSGQVTRLDLVPVSEFVVGAIDLLGDPAFLRDDLLPTTISICASFGGAALGGILLAYVMTQFGWLADGLRPFIDIFYAVPIFALYPVVVVLLGGGLMPIIILAGLFSSVVVVSSTLVGFASVPPIALKLARSLQLTRLQQFRMLLLPAALPDILAGLKLGMSYSIIAILAGEFILAPQGLGHVVANAYQSFNTVDMYAGITIVAVFSLLANLALGAALSRFDWRRR